MLAKLDISNKTMEKYNVTHCTQVNFTEETLLQLKKKYRNVRGLPGFLHNTLRGRSTPDRELILQSKDLYAWTPDLSAFITPNKSGDWFSLKDNPLAQKNKNEGLTLVAWIIDPRLLSKYGLNKESSFEDMNVFKEFILRNTEKNIASNYKYFERTSSQENIGMLEHNQNDPYLATILDLTLTHVHLLNNLKKACQKHLINNYGVNLNTDHVEMYFHFPYPESNTTLHLHIRVNHGRDPLERTRSLYLEEVINWLEKEQKISDLILKRGPFFVGDSTRNFLQTVDGISLTEIENPFIIDANIVKYSSNITPNENLITQLSQVPTPL